MELDPVMQMKNISLGIRYFPSFRESRRDAQVLVAGKQIIKEKVVDALGIRIQSHRGSKVVGLLSMIITSVSGSGLPPQERRGRSEKRPDRTRAVPTHARTHPSKTAKGGAPKVPKHVGIPVLGCAPAALNSRIRNLSQYRWALGAGRGRDIRCPTIPGFVCQQSEGGGFLCFRR